MKDFIVWFLYNSGLAGIIFPSCILIALFWSAGIDKTVALWFFSSVFLILLVAQYREYYKKKRDGHL